MTNQKLRLQDKRNYYKRNRKKILEKARQTRIRCKLTVIRAYGGKCSCCGETRTPFLSVEHKQGNGRQHRKIIAGHTWEWLIKKKFPKSFTILCHNCNLGSYINGGKCPHKEDQCESW